MCQAAEPDVPPEVLVELEEVLDEELEELEEESLEDEPADDDDVDDELELSDDELLDDGDELDVVPRLSLR
jgi:hypothetical protein